MRKPLGRPELTYEEERICIHVLLVQPSDERFCDRDACELHETGHGGHNAAEDLRAHRVDHNDHLLHQDFLGSPARAQAGSIRITGGLTRACSRRTVGFKSELKQGLFTARG